MSTQQELNDSVSTSPARKSRLQEKEELAYLNDRFASYIEQVRTLKERNLHFEYEITTLRETHSLEIQQIKALYEVELSDARTLIDETANDKAKQQLSASKNASRVKELETELREVRRELDGKKSRVADLVKENEDLKARVRNYSLDKAALQKEVKEKDAEIEELRANIEELRAALEAETLAKVDLQNNIQSLKEELAFRKKLHEEELQKMHERVTHTRGHFFETESSLDPGTFENIIDELREKSDMDIADFKEMMEVAYRDKISKLETMVARDASTITQLGKDSRRFNVTISELKAEISKLQKTAETLEDKLSMKEDEICRMSQRHNSELAARSVEVQALRENYERTIKEYEALMDLKVHLDQEIATYRALLQEEENRLNLTPTPRKDRSKRKTPSTDGPYPKRARYTQSSLKEKETSGGSTGFIQILEVDSAGRFVQIKNMAKTAESVGGFKIVHSVEGKEDITFKFHQKSKLQPGAAVTVWGAEADGAVHAPPTNVIWKGQATWGSGCSATTKLENKSGEVVASFTQRNESSPVQQTTTTSTTSESANRSFPRLPDTGEDTSSGREDMFHQEGDPPQGPERPGRESCVIC